MDLIYGGGLEPPSTHIYYGSRGPSSIMTYIIYDILNINHPHIYWSRGPHMGGGLEPPTPSPLVLAGSGPVEYLIV